MMTDFGLVAVTFFGLVVAVFVAAGLVRTFQLARGFPKLTVFDHLMPFLSGTTLSRALLVGLWISLLIWGRFRGRLFLVFLIIGLLVSDTWITTSARCSATAPLRRTFGRPHMSVTTSISRWMPSGSTGRCANREPDHALMTASLAAHRAAR